MQSFDSKRASFNVSAVGCFSLNYSKCQRFLVQDLDNQDFSDPMSLTTADRKSVLGSWLECVPIVSSIRCCWSLLVDTVSGG